MTQPGELQELKLTVSSGTLIDDVGNDLQNMTVAVGGVPSQPATFLIIPSSDIWKHGLATSGDLSSANDHATSRAMRSGETLVFQLVKRFDVAVFECPVGEPREPLDDDPPF